MAVEMTDLASRLSDLKERMEALRRSRWAKLGYCVMSDGMWWSDELPCGDLEGLELGCVRGLIRHRSAQIMNQDDIRFAELWETARSVFPGWIGFRSERCSPTKDLKIAYKRLKLEQMKACRELWDDEGD